MCIRDRSKFRRIRRLSSERRRGDGVSWRSPRVCVRYFSASALVGGCVRVAIRPAGLLRGV
eukprot:10785740-Lingulodinium_polyedra.AAC.1